MAEAIIGPLVGRLQQVAVGQAGALVAVSNDIQRLQDKLIWLQALLREADTNHRATLNEISRVWLQQTREAVFDAVDAIDHYHYHLLGSSFTRDEVDDTDVVIYVEEQKELEDALVTLSEEEERKEPCCPVLITVSGESGIGKTDLVRQIYKKMEKKKEFEVQAMESVAPYSTATNILQQIVQQLIGDSTNVPKEMARNIVEDKLRNKKYLLVIDGEVNGTEWKNILISLPFGIRCSRVVHITQGKPEEPPSRYHHVTIQLKKLKEGPTMSLFRRMLPKEMEDKNIKLFKKDICGLTQGLPLAVILLSGLLRSKEFPIEWDKVFDYLKSKQSTRLRTMLSVCFEDLPYELQCCLLYFAALPTNTTIEVRDLVYMWVADAEGFITPEAEIPMERIGYIYLSELVKRNLVNRVKMDDDTSFGSLTVTIQKEVHDFLQIEARKASFMVVHSPDGIPIIPSVCRLSLQSYTDKYSVLACPLPKLRSFFSSGDLWPRSKRSWAYIHKRKNDIRSYITELFHGSEFLRVVNLQGIEIGETLTSAVGNVVHLQYLGIKSCSLKHIPQSIGRLTSLQTLDVRETDVRELPTAFWMIKTLRHVLGFVLKFPNQIGNLKQLHTLDSINLEVSEITLDGTLGEMIHLEFLSIWHISDVNVKALSGALQKLKSLRTLVLQGNGIPSNIFRTFSLQRVKFLFLHGHLLGSSDLDNGEALCLTNLIMLSLEKTYVTQEFINKLSELPFLATLAMYPGSYKDKKLVFSSSRFQRLKKIKVIDEEILERVEVDVSVLPNLKELEVHSHDIDVYNVKKHSEKTRIIVDVRKEMFFMKKMTI
ncbi:unnamed protein product [Urochloa decumbens]|uniref:Uncharacterized protein n=1 Tax=Urochloa decumbens TaxID=240449 RepID=A0ABC9CCW1_9POAL